jgi:hypothetical protein
MKGELWSAIAVKGSPPGWTRTFLLCLMLTDGSVDAMSKPVAVCIGLSRTGTTSFGDAAEILGFSRLGWTGRYGGSNVLMEAWHRGHLNTLWSVASEFEILEDFPWPLVFRDLAEVFPDAKFVLTRRTSVETWLTSQIFHTRSVANYWVNEAVFGSASAQTAPAIYRRVYERHLSAVRQFFRSTGRLLEVCWEEGDGWEQLCSFLEVPMPRDVPFPHVNLRVT